MPTPVTLERDPAPDPRRLLAMAALAAWGGVAAWRLVARPPSHHAWWGMVTAGVPFLMLAATAFGALYPLLSLTLDGRGLTLTSAGPFGPRRVFHAWTDTSRFVADAWVPQGNGRVRAPVAARVRVRTWWGRPRIFLRIPDGFEPDREALARTLNAYRASALPPGLPAAGDDLPAPGNEARPGAAAARGLALCVLVVLALCSPGGRAVGSWLWGALRR